MQRRTHTIVIFVLLFLIASVAGGRAAGPAVLTFTGGPTDGTAGIATDVAVTFTANTSLAGMTSRTTGTWERRDAFSGVAFGSTTAPTAGTITFPTSTVGYVVGRSGGAVKTTDGGTTWMTLATGTTVDLTEVECVHATLCWIVGDNGTIRKTTDGGLTWSAQTSGTTQGLRGIAMTSATTGWAFGGNGQNPGEAVALRTTNGGTTWTSQAVPNYPGGGPARTSVSGLAAVDANTAWIIASGILKTTNGGTTWTDQTIPDSASPNVIAAVDANTAIVVGESGLILKTTNGGTTWTSQTSGTTVQLGDVTMVDASTAWVIGTGGTILKTTNGGTTWTSQTSGTTSNFIAIHAISSSIVWASAVTSGVELRTTSDGGTTWRTGTRMINVIRAASFVNGQQGWIVGDFGVVYGTSDGGRTWRYLPSGATQTLRGAHFVNATTGWVVGDGKVARKTTDGGVTWTAQTAVTADLEGDDALYDIACLDANTCWLVGDREAGGGADSASVYKTTNGGTTWTKQSTGQTSPWLLDIEVVDANTVYAVGSGGNILKTTNGGTTWTAQTLSMSDPNSNSLAAVDCTSAVRCRAGGGAGNFFDTTDGTTWAGPLSVGVTDQIEDIAYTDANTGWFITIGGTLRRTTDDGSTWSTETTGFSGTSGSALAAVDGASAVFAIGGMDVRRMGSNILLRSHAGNARSGTPSDVNACSRFTFSADGSGNANRVMTCEHAALDPGTWYTFTIGTGIALSGYELESAVTRSFRTAFATGQAFDLAATDLASLASEAYLTVSGSATAATQATFGPIIRSTVGTTDGTARVTVPQNAALTRSGGGTFDTTALALSDYTATATVVPGTKQAVVQYGVPGVALVSNAAITIAIPIPSSVAEGTALTVYRDLDGNFSDAAELTTCTVTSSTCTFTTTALSYFAVSVPSAPKVTDTTPPALPTNLQAVVAPKKVELSWQDPTDNDLGTFRVIRYTGTTASAAQLLGNVAVGVQSYADATASPETTYVYEVQSQDTTGNRASPGARKTVTTPAGNGIGAEPPPALPNSLEQIAQTIAPPCALTTRERTFLVDAFQRTQVRAPGAGRDLAFLCVLRTDPGNPADPTKEYPEYRNLDKETLALKNFVNFFQRPPGFDAKDHRLLQEAYDRDWWAVKYMAYHLRLAPTVRDIVGERVCLKLFVDREVDLYKNGVKTRKLKGDPPKDVFDYDFIRACTYSGVKFL